MFSHTRTCFLVGSTPYYGERSIAGTIHIERFLWAFEEAVDVTIIVCWARMPIVLPRLLPKDEGNHNLSPVLKCKLALLTVTL